MPFEQQSQELASRSPAAIENKLVESISASLGKYFEKGASLNAYEANDNELSYELLVAGPDVLSKDLNEGQHTTKRLKVAKPYKNLLIGDDVNSGALFTCMGTPSAQGFPFAAICQARETSKIEAVASGGNHFAGHPYTANLSKGDVFWYVLPGDSTRQIFKLKINQKAAASQIEQVLPKIANSAGPTPDASELTEVGIQYLTGHGKDKDYAKAAEYLRRAAAAHDPRAQTNLGWMLTLGQGVTRDDAAALRLFDEAAVQGYPNAADSLGYMFENGRGTAVDLGLAESWYAKAAERGFSKSAANLERVRARIAQTR